MASDRNAPVDGQRARKELVADAILERAAGIFADRGFQGTTIGDIAEAMDMSRPAVYHYFESKEALLEALVEGMTGGNVELLREVRADKTLSSLEKLAEIVRRLSERVAAKPVLMRVLASNGASLPPHIAVAHAAGRREALEHVEALITEGIAAGEIAPVDERLAAFAIFGMCDGIAWWYSPDGRSDAATIGETFAAITVQGLARTDGRGADGAPGIEHALKLLREDVDYLAQLLPSRPG